MITDKIIADQLALIRSGGCRVHRVAETRFGETVILYSPVGRFDIYARIVYASGVATKRFVNDLSLHVSPVEGAPDPTLYLQYVRVLGDKINRGFGSMLLRELLLVAEQNGIRRIEGRMQQADLAEHRERLLHFYGKFGFVVADDGRICWESAKRSAPLAMSSMSSMSSNSPMSSMSSMASSPAHMTSAALQADSSLRLVKAMKSLLRLGRHSTEH